ncbi:MAG: hypothetical protein ACFFDN_16530 [Candidatus Hodarchaeota archaeon]
MVNIKDNTNKGNFEEISTVKKYFARIFSVLSKEVREKLLNLNVSEEKRKKIKKELAFLSNKKQKEYLDELKRNNKS